MWNNFKAVSLSHRKAPVAVRERMYLGDDLCRMLPARMQELLGLDEVLVLSTCNRTEVYYLSDEDMSTEIVKVLCIEKGLLAGEDLSPYFEVIADNDVAVRHLFEVSLGLQSSVVGDLQISNQVKKAYSNSVDAKLAGPFLHRLMHTIFHANKRVQQETPWRDGAASVSYAAAELVQELVAQHESPSALVAGLGEMGRDVALHLAGGRVSRLGLSNRTRQVADDLAQHLGASPEHFGDLAECLRRYDVIVFAASVEEPAILPSHLEGKDRFRQRYFIDLSVPRGIHPDVAKVPGVVVYTIDEIQSQANGVLEKRLSAVPQVQAIISHEMEGFAAWCREFAISPVIQKFKDALEAIRQEELARHLKHADAKQVELVEKVTLSMMNKIVKLPVLQLKAACQRGEEAALIGVLNDLFDLEGVKEGSAGNPH
jgi:glutamyl-tRNA reductase